MKLKPVSMNEYLSSKKPATLFFVSKKLRNEHLLPCEHLKDSRQHYTDSKFKTKIILILVNAEERLHTVDSYQMFYSQKSCFDCVFNCYPIIASV